MRDKRTPKEASLQAMWIKRTKQCTGSVFRISFHTDWLIDNGFLNRPIIERAQILVHRWGPRARTQLDFSFVCDAGYYYPVAGVSFDYADHRALLLFIPLSSDHKTFDN